MLNSTLTGYAPYNLSASEINLNIPGTQLNALSVLPTGNIQTALDLTVGGQLTDANSGTFGANVSVSTGQTGQILIGGDSNGSIEIGQQGRAISGTPYIDFHSSTAGIDYDARIIASGGGTLGTGNIDIISGNINVSGNLAVAANAIFQSNVAISNIVTAYG